MQGPHHSAQKSTRTGVVDLRASASKFCAVKVTIKGEAIYLFGKIWGQAGAGQLVNVSKVFFRARKIQTTTPTAMRLVTAVV